jgi:hypothetical protein
VNGVVGARQLVVDVHDFQTDEAQPALLEAADDRANEPTLHGVGLENDQ